MQELETQEQTPFSTFLLPRLQSIEVYENEKMTTLLICQAWTAPHPLQPTSKSKYHSGESSGNSRVTDARSLVLPSVPRFCVARGEERWPCCFCCSPLLQQSPGSASGAGAAREHVHTHTSRVDTCAQVTRTQACTHSRLARAHTWAQSAAAEEAPSSKALVIFQSP